MEPGMPLKPYGSTSAKRIVQSAPYVPSLDDTHLDRTGVDIPARVQQVRLTLSQRKAYPYTVATAEA
jgi:hypothetical protein